MPEKASAVYAKEVAVHSSWHTLQAGGDRLAVAYISIHSPTCSLFTVFEPLNSPTFSLREHAKMKFSTGSSVPLIALSAMTVVARVEESLYSKRMVKRGIDAEGNYNICKPTFEFLRVRHTHVLQPSSTSTMSTPTSMNLAPRGPIALGPKEAAMVATRASRPCFRSSVLTTRTACS
jgi:hypothetical protein